MTKIELRHSLVVVVELSNFGSNFTNLPSFQTVFSIKHLPVHADKHGIYYH